MNISMMSYTMARGEWGKNHDIEELCKFTKELGLEGIDWVTTYGVDPKEIRRIGDDYGLRTVCYTFFADINFSEKKDRQPGIDKIKEGIEFASILGTDKIMLPIGGKDGLSREQSRKNIVTGLKDAVEIGKEYGVTVTVEHFTDKRGPFITSTDMNEAISEVPDLRITYDNGNIFVGGEDPITGFINSKESIVHAHFKDWALSADGNGLKGFDGRTYVGALVGEGLVDHKGILKAMKKSNYKGYINFEYEGNKYEPKDATIRGIKYLRDLIFS